MRSALLGLLLAGLWPAGCWEGDPDNPTGCAWEDADAAAYALDDLAGAWAAEHNTCSNAGDCAEVEGPLGGSCAGFLVTKGQEEAFYAYLAAEEAKLECEPRASSLTPCEAGTTTTYCTAECRCGSSWDAYQDDDEICQDDGIYQE